MSEKDNIFNSGNFDKGSFKFDEKVAGVFDDMVNRSVPYYKDIQKLTCLIATDFATKGSHIYDLGCSTGTTLLNISKALDFDIKLIGLDPAKAMIQKAKNKSANFTYGKRIEFKCNSCIEEDFTNASMIIMNYTLQFIKTENRQPLLKKIYDSLNPNGVLLISEKVREETASASEYAIKNYYRLKSENGYSELEIANKRDALEDILIPQTHQDNIKDIKSAGFESVSTVFKWFNFTTYLAVKQS